jgi:probable phosphoglycerate mutase
MGEIILLRHGETEWSKQGRHTGRTDVPLTAEGEQRARIAGQALAKRPIVAVWTSPALRARRTAQLAGLPVEGTDPDLWEWDYGGYEGRTTAQIQQERPGWYLWDDGVIPGAPGSAGETAQQVGERCDRVIARVTPLVRPGSPDAVDGDVALVAHGHVLRILAARWLGLPARAGADFLLGTAAVCALGFEHERPGISLWNQNTCE